MFHILGACTMLEPCKGKKQIWIINKRFFNFRYVTIQYNKRQTGRICLCNAFRSIRLSWWKVNQLECRFLFYFEIKYHRQKELFGWKSVLSGVHRIMVCKAFVVVKVVRKKQLQRLIEIIIFFFIKGGASCTPGTRSCNCLPDGKKKKNKLVIVLALLKPK